MAWPKGSNCPAQLGPLGGRGSWSMKSLIDWGKPVPELPHKDVIYEHCRSKTNITTPEGGQFFRILSDFTPSPILSLKRRDNFLIPWLHPCTHQQSIVSLSYFQSCPLFLRYVKKEKFQNINLVTDAQQ